MSAEFPLYGTDPSLKAIQADRQKVYGDPKENHDGIAMGWVGLLQPHWQDIRDGKPIPAWCVALLLAALKLNRMRRVFKQDNYDDIRNYLQFAQDWQSESQCSAPSNTSQPPSPVDPTAHPTPKGGPEPA